MKKCPDEYLSRWFSILHRLSLRGVTESLKEFRIGSGQIMFLLELYYCDGVRQEELCAHLNIDGSNTTRAIAKLEAEGYVRRQDDKEDGRAQRIFLTEKAQAIKTDIFALLRSWDEQLLEALSADEQEVFLKLLKKMGHAASKSARCLVCEQQESCE